MSTYCKVEDASELLAAFELTGLDEVKAKYNDTGKLSTHFRCAQLCEPPYRWVHAPARMPVPHVHEVCDMHPQPRSSGIDLSFQLPGHDA